MDFKPLAGQVLTVRFGAMQYDERVRLYWLLVRPGDGSQCNLQMTDQVMDALLGPSFVGSPERNAWDAARAAVPGTGRRMSTCDAWGRAGPIACCGHPRHLLTWSAGIYGGQHLGEQLRAVGRLACGEPAI